MSSTRGRTRDVAFMLLAIVVLFSSSAREEYMMDHTRRYPTMFQRSMFLKWIDKIGRILLIFVFVLSCLQINSPQPVYAEAEPVITIGGELSEFSTEAGSPSAEQSYTVAASDLSEDLLITAPANFEISTTSGDGFSSELTLTPDDNGMVAETSVFVRLSSNEVGDFSGTILHTSGEGVSAEQAVSGSAVEPAIVEIESTDDELVEATATTITFTAEELLGCPTDEGVTINIVPASTIEYYYQYGTEAGVYSGETSVVTATANQPSEVVISGLDANTKYFYRMRYHLPGETDWVNRTEHSFWTQRAEGSTFSFTVGSDIHYNLNTQLTNSMTNMLNEDADFYIDLGDTFYVDSQTTQSAVNSRYLAYRDPAYFDKIGSSMPIFLSSGNHENEEGWNLDDTFSLGVASIQARKAYYPTPIDGIFYS